MNNDRHFPNFLDAYTQYASFSESPRHIHWWVGVSTIAGVLGRKVYIDQPSFQWLPNHYIFFVGPPDVLSKSTSMKMGMSLLKKVPGFIMGPTTCSWQGLVQTMAEEMERDYDLGDGKIIKLCACTVASSELGNFLKPKDGEFLDVMISLWDGDTIDKKLIKEGGSRFIENPLLNLLGCTTPSWIAMNIPEHMLEGGLLSRVIMVYGDKIDHPVAYPDDNIPPDFLATREKLISDLVQMDSMKGEMRLRPEAKRWGKAWYDKMKMGDQGKDEKQRDRLTRKQTHVHKLAIILSAARSNDRWIELEDLQRAVTEIDALAAYRSTIIASVGQTPENLVSDHLLSYIRKVKSCRMSEAYRVVHHDVPTSSSFSDVLNGLVKAGLVKEQSLGGEIILSVTGCTA